MVGEMRGQLREVVHTLNNVSSKIDGLSREVIAMGPLAAELAEVKGEIKLAQAEIAALKSERDQRKAWAGSHRAAAGYARRARSSSYGTADT